MAMEKWYEKLHRFGQTNLTEIDPEVCDLEFWKEFWKKTGTQAIIVNAGGIVAYYPSKFKTHYRAAKLGNRDLFGEFAAEGRKAGLAVLARMDINRAVKEFYDEKPEWFARKKDGSPFFTQGRYLGCVNSGYYKEFVPDVLKEIIEKYHPDGFTDNSWTGIARSSICYCENCKKSFRDYSGADLPEAADFNNPVYRKWIKWSYKSRLDNWDLFNGVTRKYGGEDCLWLGMVNANFVSGHASFCDLRELSRRSKIIMVDHQSRDGNGFEQNSLNGLLLHQIAGWDKIIPESMATYSRGLQAYRRGASPALELKLWMMEGFAGGITPWWHIIGGAQEDRRIFDLPVEIMQWHQKYERYLYKRAPAADTGIIWSQANVEFFGGAKAKERMEHSWRGIIMALTKAGLPFLPVNADDIAEQTRNLSLLILPELALVTETQAAALEAFVKRGGRILAIGQTGIMNEDGDLRKSSRLEKLLGIRYTEIKPDDFNAENSWESPVLHTYLRVEEGKNPVFAGFEKTACIPMGGLRCGIEAAGAKVLATFIPAFPMYPPEFVWTEVSRTDKPVITEYEGAGGKTMYAAWDLDSCYGRAAHPDHGNLLGNMVRYLLGGDVTVKVDCEAYIDFKIYRQDKRVIIHLINANNTGFSQGYAEKNIPVGPVSVTLKMPDCRFTRAGATEDDAAVKLTEIKDGVTLELPVLGVHQLIIVE